MLTAGACGAAVMAMDLEINAEDAARLKLDPEETAEKAGLHYVRPEDPGYRRKKWGRGYVRRSTKTCVATAFPTPRQWRW